jgi:hypothetical protein
MSRPLALALLVLAGCRAAVAPAPAVEPRPHGPGHADPAVPVALAVAVIPQPDGSAVLTVAATPREALPSLAVGIDLPQSLALVSGRLRVDAPAPAPGVAVTVSARLRRLAPGAAGITARAWVEHRSPGLVLGDERPVTLFGPPPATQGLVERTVAGPDGGALHETVIP